MDNINRITKDLINSIHTSEEYLKYKKYKKIIDDNIELKNKINDFKKMQVQTEVKLTQGIFVSDDEKKELQNLYTELTLNENIDIYLQCEKILFKTIESIYDEIVNSIDISLDFIE